MLASFLFSLLFLCMLGMGYIIVKHTEAINNLADAMVDIVDLISEDRLEQYIKDHSDATLGDFLKDCKT